MFCESLVDLQSLSCFSVEMSSSSVNAANNNNVVVAGLNNNNNNKKSVLADKNDFFSEKEDYSYLDRKPTAMDHSRKRSGAGSSKKWRRNAYEDFYNTRKDSVAAFLVKNIEIPPSQINEQKIVGKKRRARLLSASQQHDDFNQSVPYSLNRKKRWLAMENQADYLINSASAEHSACVHFSILESYLTGLIQPLADTELLIQACHSYEKPNNNNNNLIVKNPQQQMVVTSRYAKSARGSTIKDLLNPQKSILNNENNNGKTAGSQATKNSSSKRAPLKDNYDLNVQYKIFKQHPILKCMGVHVPKKEHLWAKGKKHCSNISLSNCGLTHRVLSEHESDLFSKKRSDDYYTTEDDKDNDEKKHRRNNDEDEEEVDENVSMYRAPRNDTYSLADFVKDNYTSPVIVKRPKSILSLNDDDDISNTSDADINNEIAELVELDDDENCFDIEILRQNNNENSLQKTHNNKLDAQKLFSGCFKTNVSSSTRKGWQLNASTFGILSLNEFVSQSDSLASQFPIKRVCSTERLYIDLTKLLIDQMELRIKNEEPLLTLTIEYKEKSSKIFVLLNGAFTISEAQILPNLNEFKASTFSDLVQEIVRQFKPCFENECSIDTSTELNCSEHLESLRNVYQASLLNTTTCSLDTYQILAELYTQNKHESKKIHSEEEASNYIVLENKVLQVPPKSHINDKFDDDEDEEDFELVEMNDFPEQDAEIVVEKLLTVVFCGQCGYDNGGENDDNLVENRVEVVSSKCGHRFCSNCLTQATVQFMEKTQNLLVNRNATTTKNTITVFKCLDMNCECEIPIETLELTLPISILTAYARLKFALVEWQKGRMICRKPGCSHLLIIDGIGEFNQISCQICALSWCSICVNAGHWPLNCHENEIWSKKFAEQCKNKGGNRHNKISQQFSSVCSDARTRRLDLETGKQLARNFRRLTDYKQERQFTTIRNAALHMLEYGTGWLYLSQQQQQQRVAQEQQCSAKNWQSLKQQLFELNKHVESLDSELLFSGSLTDPTQLIERLNRMQKLIQLICKNFAKIHKI